MIDPILFRRLKESSRLYDSLRRAALGCALKEGQSTVFRHIVRMESITDERPANSPDEADAPSDRQQQQPRPREGFDLAARGASRAVMIIAQAESLFSEHLAQLHAGEVCPLGDGGEATDRIDKPLVGSRSH
jgi:hypothetical protein